MNFQTKPYHTQPNFHSVRNEYEFPDQTLPNLTLPNPTRPYLTPPNFHSVRNEYEFPDQTLPNRTLPNPTQPYLTLPSDYEKNKGKKIK
jgi:hypothetical protein